MTEVEQIARGLTKAQREIVLSLPASGDFGPAASHRTAKYMWYGIGDGRAEGRGVRLVDHQYMTVNSWCLNPLGLRVRQWLMENDDAD